jgi:hypothetical protein
VYFFLYVNIIIFVYFEIGGIYGERRVAYRPLVRKPNGKRRLERRRLRWEDNIKTDL